VEDHENLAELAVPAWRLWLGVATLAGGVALAFGIDAYFARTSELAEVTGDDSLNAGADLWAVSPFALIAILSWSTRLSVIGLAFATAAAVVLTATMYDAYWNSDSSTAGLALVFGPLYAMATVAAVWGIDGVVRAVRKPGRPAEPPRT
jgi:hypothetical protein